MSFESGSSPLGRFISTYEQVRQDFGVDESPFEEREKELLLEVLRRDQNLSEIFNRTFQEQDRPREYQWKILGDAATYLKTKVSTLPVHEQSLLQELIQKIDEVYQKATQSDEWHLIAALEEMALLIGKGGENSLIEKGSILKTRKVVSLDEKMITSAKLFAHIHGESFIQNTRFEGVSGASTINYLKRFLQENGHGLLEDKKRQELVQMLSDAEEFSLLGMSAQGNLQEFSAHFKTIHDSLKEKIGKLQIGQRTLISSGYRSRSTRHAMLLEISRREDGKLDLKVYNSGDGLLQYHAMLWDEETLLTLPFIEIVEVTEERFLSEEFLRPYLEILTLFSTHEEGRDPNYGPEDLYGLLLFGLDGKVIRTSLDRSKLIPPQQSGTCSWSRLLAFLHTDLSLDEYQKIDFEIGLDSLCAFYQTFPKGEIGNEERQLLIRSASLFSQKVLEAFEKGSIDLETFQKVYATLNELHQDVQKAANKELLKKGTFEPSFEGLGSSSSDRQITLEVKKTSVDTAKTSTTSPTPPLFDPGVIDQPESLIDCLERLIPLQKSLLSRDEKDLVVQNFHQFFRALPLLDAKDAPWVKMEKEGAEMAISKFSELTDLLFLTKGKDPDPALDAYSFYLLAQSIDLGRKVEELAPFLQEKSFPYELYRNNSVGHPYLGGIKGDQNLYEPFQRALREKALSFFEASYQTDPYTYNKKIFVFNDQGSFSEISESAYYSGSQEENLFNVKLEQDEGFQERLFTLNPQLKGATRGKQLGTILSDFQGEILSKAHAALRRQALTSVLMADGRVPLVSIETSLEKGKCISPIVVKKGDSYKITLEGISGEKVDTFYLSKKEIPENFGELKDPILRKIVDASRRKPGEHLGLLAEANVVADDFGNLFLDDASAKFVQKKGGKELLLLMTRGDINRDDPHLEQQVLKVLSYFQENQELVGDPEVGALLKLLLFESNLLEKVLKLNPKMGDKLAAFVTKGWEHFYASGKMERAAYFIDLGRTLEKIVSSQGIKSPFLPFRETLVEVLEKGALEENEKALFSEQLAASYSSHPPDPFLPEDGRRLVSSLIYIHSFPHLLVENHHLKEEITRARALWKEEIKTAFQSKEGGSIVKKIMGEFYKEGPPPPLDCLSSYPVCTSPDGAIQLDVERGLFSLRGGEMASLPPFIFDHKAFPEGLCQKGTLCQSLGNDRYQFRAIHGELTEVQWSPEDNRLKVIQKLENGKWYQLDSNRKEWGFLTKGGSLWVPLEEEGADHAFVRDEQFQTTHKILLGSEISSPPKAALEYKEETIREGLDFFLIDLKEGELRTALLKRFISSVSPEKVKNILSSKIFDAAWTQPISLSEGKALTKFLSKTSLEISQTPSYFTLDMTPEEQEYYKEQFDILLPILRITPSEIETREIKGYLKLLPSGKSLELASPLKGEVFEGSLLWKTSDGFLKLLEMPSYGLEFEMKREERGWRAHSAEFPAFFIQAESRPQRYLKTPCCFLLENREGAEKLIVPLGEIVQDQKGSLSTSFTIASKPNGLQKSIAFEIKNGEIHPSGKEQKLYFAKLLFAEKEYLRALGQIKEVCSSPIPLKESEIEMLVSLALQIQQSLDESPEGTALLLLTISSLLALPLKEKIAPEKVIPLHSLIQRYQSYLLNRGQIPKFSLSKDEEENILQLLSKDDNLGPLIKKGGEVSLLVARGVSLSEEEKGKGENIGWDEKRFLALCKELKKGEEDQNIALTRPGKAFTSKIKSYYSLAKEGNRALNGPLFFAKKDPNVPSHLTTLLSSVLEHPEVFPSIVEFNEILSSENWTAFSAKIIPHLSESEESYKKEEEGKYVDTSVRSEKLGRSTSAFKLIERGLDTSSLEPFTPLEAHPDILTKGQLEKSFERIPSESLRLTSEEKGELLKAMQGDGAPILPKETESIVQDINDYWTPLETGGEWHQVRPKAIDSLKTTLLVEKGEIQKRLYLEERELLEFANKLPQKTGLALVLLAEKGGHLRSPVTLDDLFVLAARSKHYSATGKNPTLQGQERELIQKTLAFLSRKARYQQLERAVRQVKELETLDVGGKAYKKCSEMLYREITRKAPYDAHLHPELLLFEVRADMGLYDWQVEDLLKLDPTSLTPQNLILQKIMGSGKTKVYLSILALMQADGDFVSFVVVPEFQYETVAEAMEIQSGQIFHQRAKTFKFDRKGLPPSVSLEKVLEILKEVRSNKDFLVLTDRTLHSLNLAFKEAWVDFLEAETIDAGALKKIERVREIQRLLSKKGKAIFDEADFLLNCRYQVVYAMGEAKPLDPRHMDLVADLYRSIANALEELKPITQDRYESLIRSRCVEAFIETVLPQRMAGCDQEKVKAYLLSQKEGARYVDGLPKEVRDELAIALREFEQLLPMTLQRRAGEHFGYSDDPEKILPVPFVASGVPSTTSSFSFPYTLLNFTLQTLESEGIGHNLLKKLISQIQQRATKEMDVDPTMKLEKTKAYSDFQDLCLHKVKIPLYRVSDKEIEKLRAAYAEDRASLLSFAKKHLFPEVKQHPGELVSTPYALYDLFFQVQGFTATPWNRATYPKGLRTETDIASSGKTLGVIFKNSPEVAKLPQVAGVDKIVEETIALQNSFSGSFHAYIDTGAVFVGMDNEKVAKTFLKRLSPSIKGVVYFKNNVAMVLIRGKNVEVPLAKCGLEPSELYIYYDQWHTTGTDLKIGGRSLLSIGKTTKRRDLEQAYGRDRESDSASRVILVLPSEVETHLRAELKLQADEPIKVSDVELFTERNHEDELIDQMMMATVGKMEQTVEKELKKILENPDIDPISLREKKDPILDLLIHVKRDDPYADMGTIAGEIPREKVFEHLIEKMVQKAKPLFSETIFEKLSKELWACVDIDAFPETLSFPLHTSADQLVELQTEYEGEEETETFVTKTQISDLEEGKVGRWAVYLWSWLTDQPVSNSLFYPLKTVEEIKKMDQPTLGRRTDTGRGDIYLPDSQENVPIMELKNVFQSNNSLEKFSDIFDLEASYNFLPVWSSLFNFNRGGGTTFAIPFEKAQTPVKQLLILKSPIDKTSRVILLSQSDAGFFFEKLAEEQKSSQNKELQVVLYDLNLGVIQSNEQELIEGEKAFLDEEVKRKIVQAKFYKGELVYRPEERKLLEEWIKEKGVERMEELFTKHILRFDEQKQKDYPKSQLPLMIRRLKTENS